MRKILYLRHPAFDSKTGAVTDIGWRQFAALLPTITALFTQATVWVSSETRAKQMGEKIGIALGGSLVEEQIVLNTVKWDGERGIPGCHEIYAEAKAYLAHRPEASIVTAILAATGGTEYLHRKVASILEQLRATTGNIIVVGHESSVEGIGWATFGQPFGSKLPDGLEIRYVEGLLLTKTGGAFQAEIVRNPFYG